MKTIIAGTRSIDNYDLLVKAISECPWSITHIVSGMAIGIDRLAVDYAVSTGIPYTEYPVSSDDWRIHGLSAGKLRNSKMAKNAEALLAIWDGTSGGTADMIAKAQFYKLRVHTYLVK